MLQSKLAPHPGEIAAMFASTSKHLTEQDLESSVNTEYAQGN